MACIKVTKKLEKLGKEEGYETVLEWIKPIQSHLYWCACYTKRGYAKLFWQSENLIGDT